MAKKFLFFVLYVLVPIGFLGFLFWYGWGGDIGQKNTFILKSGLNGDFGAVNLKIESVDKLFGFVNTGKEPVEISKVYSDCDCLLGFIQIKNEFLGPFGKPVEENTRPIGLIVPAGGEMILKAVFYPPKFGKGIFKGNVFVETYKAKQIANVPISAVVISGSIKE